MSQSPRRVGRLIHYLCAAFCLLASAPAFAVNPSKDLAGAFGATYQQAPPLIRVIKEPIADDRHPGHVMEVLTRTATLAPARLVQLSGTRYALFVSETIWEGGHSAPGAFSVSYLRYDKTWTLEQIWPELAFLGRSGRPADVIWGLSFGADPLVLTSSTYCGMGVCSESIGVFSLERTTPRFLGIVPGKFENGLSLGLNHCPLYHRTVRIGAPTLKRGAFSALYSEWTVPSGSPAPKHWFRRTTNYIVSTSGLIASPALQLAECW